MKFTSSLMSQTSGSVGGSTYSRNRYGNYIRDRATPVNPQSAQQVAVRSLFAQLANLWSGTLTLAQRQAWDTYATNVAMTDALGNVIHPTGFNHYIRSNVPRLQAGLPRVDAGPVVFDLGEFTPVTNVTSGVSQDYSLTFTNTDDWANEDDSAMLVYGSRQMAPTINFFKGPFRFAGKVDGDGTTPPTSPVSIGSPFAVSSPNVAYIRVRVSRADGRLSTDQIIRGVISPV